MHMKSLVYTTKDGISHISHYYDVGDKITILRRDIFQFEHRKIRTGVITRKLAPDVFYVRPSWCNWEIELYACEISPITKIQHHCE